MIQHVAQARRNDAHSYPVMLHSKKPVTILANQKICLMGNVRLRKKSQNISFVIESPEQYKLPGGLLIESVLLDSPSKASTKVTVIVRNVCGHNVTLQPNSVVAQACAAQHVSPLPPGQTKIPPSQTEQKNSKFTFNLDESPISEQGKE